MAVEIVQLISKIGSKINEMTVGLEFEVMPNTVFRVSKIAYCRKGYNKGNQGDWPAYKVEFEDTKLRMVIPEKNVENMVTNIVGKNVKAHELPDDTPDLPELVEEEEVEMTTPEPPVPPMGQGM